MRHKLKLYLLLVIFVILMTATLAVQSLANGIDNTEDDVTTSYVITEIGDNEYSLVIIGDYVDFTEDLLCNIMDKITAVTVENGVLYLPKEVLCDLPYLKSLTIKAYDVLIPVDTLDILPFTRFYIHELSTANSALYEYRDRISYICEFSDGECIGCGYKCTAHFGGAATCHSGAICAKCGIEYENKLQHTGGTATCKDKAVCTACGDEYGELAKDHTGGTATCKEKARCSVCGEEGFGCRACCL